MSIAPNFDTFAAAYAAGEAGVLRTTLVGDLLTPVAAFMKLRHGRKGPAFLLESVEGGAVRGRFSMIGLDPDLVWRCQDGVASIDRETLSRTGDFRGEDQPPLESLRALIKESALPLSDDLPPMAAGLFGYLGYDMVRLMERLPEQNPDARHLSGGAGPALRVGLPAPRLCALPLLAAGQSGSVPGLSRLRAFPVR